MPSYSRRDEYSPSTTISLNNPTSTSNPGSAPASPVPSSPKAVRFAPRASELVTGVSRPLTPTEAWSLYHFEIHIRQCPACYIARESHRLCDVGRPLAHDVAMQVTFRDGEVYSTVMDSGKPIRVEVPHGYYGVRNLVKSLHRSAKKSARPSAPVVTYEVRPPVSAIRQRTPELEPDREDVVIEPSRIPSTRKPKLTKTRYQIISPDEPATLVSSEESEASKARRREAAVNQKRGSLYERDIQRPKKEYRVEIREPADVSRKREKERRREEESRAGEQERRDQRRRREKRREE